MKHRFSILVALILAAPQTLFAGEKEEELIAKVTQAYGGEALVGLSNYRIHDRFLGPTTGQSHSPNLKEVNESAQYLTVDLKNNKAIIERWSKGRTGSFQVATISDGEKAYDIDYQAGNYGDASNADRYSFAGGTMRTSDTVLAYELNKVKDKAVLADDTSYLSRPHHVLTIPFPNSPDLNLYIDAKTYLISKMLRVNPTLGNLDYVYSDHKKIDGIASASRINFFIAGEPTLISTKHELAFNLALDDDYFKIPEGLSAADQRIDTSEMMATKLADGIYHIGQNGGFSLFIDSPQGVIAAGGYAGLGARFERYQKDSDNYKPLAFQVVTHHHSDHIGGLSEAVDLGAKLVTVKDNIETLKTGVNPSPNDADFFKVGARTTLGDGRSRVEIHEVSTAHADSFLVTYVPSQKLIFIADHFGSPYKKTLPTANLGTVDMLAALDQLGLKVERVSTAHSARIFTMKEMRKSVAAYAPTSCVGGRPICP